MPVWKIIGFGLLAWSLYDIAKGRTYLHRSISRVDEPILFWAVAASWVSLATTMIIMY